MTAVDATLDELCVVACAEVFRGDGEILASPMGLIPSLGAKLARATFAPDLLMTDGVASLVDVHGNVEGYMPYRALFDLVWAGKRHVVMGASQIDMHGNQNISCIGPHEKPKTMLLGVRGAPGNTIHHPTSYFIPSHTTRSFVARVDMVSGVGFDRAAALPKSSARFHDVRRVVSNKGVFDFVSEGSAPKRMRIASLHPGVSVEDVIANTGFQLVIPEGVPTTRLPTAAELHLIRDVFDPQGLRKKELA
jgi:acyl CoA:acetate/3-ketoacid CoA transferase beta subunit